MLVLLVLRVATAACNTVSVAASAAPASTPLLPLSLLMLQSYCYYSCFDTHNIIFFPSVTCKKINHDVNGGYLSTTCVHYCYDLNFFGTNSGALYIKMYCNGYVFKQSLPNHKALGVLPGYLL